MHLKFRGRALGNEIRLEKTQYGKVPLGCCKGQVLDPVEDHGNSEVRFALYSSIERLTESEVPCGISQYSYGSA